MAGMDQQRRLSNAMAINPPIKERAAARRAWFDLPIDRRSHIGDVLIEERAGRMLEHPLLWQTVRQCLYPLLKYDEAIRLADAVAHLSGFEAFSLVSRELGIRTKVSGLEHVPKNGFMFIVANHPTGIADGIAVFDGLAPVRPDLCFMANRDAIRVADGLSDIIIPVDWRPAFRTTAKTRETVQGLTRAAREERAVVIFPSGRLAYMTMNGLRERPWLSTTVSLARRYRAPILPLRITSRNSWLYYGLAQISSELRDITVFNELLNKQGAHVGLTFGPPIDPAELPDDSDAATDRLQQLVEFEMA
jgi:putative hemolysin